jgi:hypothetical protein
VNGLPPRECPICGQTGFVSYLCFSGVHGFGRRQGPGGRFLFINTDVWETERVVGCSECLECADQAWALGWEASEVKQ